MGRRQRLLQGPQALLKITHALLAGTSTARGRSFTPILGSRYLLHCLYGLLPCYGLQLFAGIGSTADEAIGAGFVAGDGLVRSHGRTRDPLTLVGTTQIGLWRLGLRGARAIGVVLTPVILCSGDGPAPSTLVTGSFWEPIHPGTGHDATAEARHGLHLVYATPAELRVAVAGSRDPGTAARLIARHLFRAIHEIAGDPLPTLRAGHFHFGRFRRFGPRPAQCLEGLGTEILRTRYHTAGAGLEAGDLLVAVHGGTGDGLATHGVCLADLARGGLTIDGHARHPGLRVLRTGDPGICTRLRARHPIGTRLVRSRYRQLTLLRASDDHLVRPCRQVTATETLKVFQAEVLRTGHRLAAARLVTRDGNGATELGPTHPKTASGTADPDLGRIGTGFGVAKA